MLKKSEFDASALNVHQLNGVSTGFEGAGVISGGSVVFEVTRLVDVLPVVCQKASTYAVERALLTSDCRVSIRCGILSLN